MLKFLLIAVVCFGLFIFYSGCYYDKADQVYPNVPPCDTSNVKLSVQLNDIMAANCFSCHGGTASLGGGIQLQDYTVLKAYVNNGQLLSAINQDGKVPAMPLSGSKLSDCSINQFKAWVNAGAPNN